MDRRDPSRIPPANALIAFESAAQHGSFTLAARELRTAPSTVSRQIGHLEMWLSVRLFERSNAGATLTDAGERFRAGVAAGLAAIHRGAAEAAELSTAEQVVIACSHEASHFFLMPRSDALRRVLGEHVQIRILTDHHYIQGLPTDPSADILLTWLGVVGGLVRGRRTPGPGAAPPRARPLRLRAGGRRRREWHRAGLALLHRAVRGCRRTGRARGRVRRIRPRLLRRAHRDGTPQAARAQVPRILRPVRIAQLPRRGHEDRGRARRGARRRARAP